LRPPPPAVILAVAALGAVAFAPGIRDMWGRWFAEGTYYGHGPLVPLVSGWFLWRDRERLRATPRGSSALGVALVAAALALALASVLEEVHFTQNFALVGAIAGAALALYGPAVVRAAWFPLAFLALMVPLPEVAIAHATFALKMFAARFAVGVIALGGWSVVLDGSTIHLATTSLTVDDVCSGLRTLFSLLALAAIFANLERSRGRALVVVAAAVPIAVVANVARILGLCALAANGFSIEPDGLAHELTGLSVFAVAALLLTGLRALPSASTGEEAPPPAPPPLDAAPADVAPSRLRLAVLVGLFALAAAAATALDLAAPPPEATTATRAIPRVIGRWVGTDVPLEPRIHAILGTEDVLVRRYASVGGREVVLYVVHAAESRRVAHPPEICFSGGGYVEREAGAATLAAAGGRAIPANRMVLERGGQALLVYYWFRLDGRDTASYLEHQLETLLRRVRRERREASMVRLSTSIGPEGVAGAEARLKAFADEALGPALAAIP
jgi:EpsI family protein